MKIHHRWSTTLVMCSLALIMTVAGTATAQWSHDPGINTRAILDSSNGSRFLTQSVSDGSGGIISLWMDSSTSGLNLMAQRIDQTGTRMFGDNGIILNTGGDVEESYSLAPDGNGGFFVAWNRTSSTGTLVLAQHFDSQGNSTWTTGGVAMQQFVIVGTIQSEPQVVSAGDGGAIVAWIDKTDDTHTVYETRINSFGSRVWSVVTVANPEVEIRRLFVAAGETTGESYLVWEQYFPNTDWNVYTQIISPTGETVIPYYHTALSGVDEGQFLPQVVPYEDGGLLATWYDSSDGTVRYTWKERSGNNRIGGASGATFGRHYDNFDNLKLVKGNNQDAFILCSDSTTDQSGMDRIAAMYLNGYNFQSWGYYGRTVFEGINTKPLSIAGLADGQGGLFVSWEDNENGFLNATHLNANGMVDWPGDPTEFSRRIITQFVGDEMVLVDDGANGFIASWLGYDYDVNKYAPAVQKIDPNGFMGDNTFSMSAVEDRPNDQGGELIATWQPSPLDNSAIGAISSYSIWVENLGSIPSSSSLQKSNELLIPDLELASMLRMEEAHVAELRTAGWVFAGQVPAVFASEYSAFCPSFGDSTEAGIVMTGVKVIAHHEDPNIFWTGLALEGYSVDNLAPGAPLALAGENNNGAADLTWTASGSHDEDLSVYRIYRGSEAGFIMDESTLVGQSPTVDYLDQTASGTVFYRVTAVDVHGNEGLASGEAMVQLGVSAVEGAPTVFHHRGNYPNPFNPMTQIAFDVPAASQVKVTVYDAGGRLVKTLISQTMDAGQHEVRWNGQDSHGQSVASGVYFSRVEAGEFTATKSMMLVR